MAQYTPKDIFLSARIENVSGYRTRPNGLLCAEHRFPSPRVQVDLLWSRFCRFTANIDSGEIPIIAVYSGTHVDDHQVTMMDYPVRGEAAIRTGIGTRADNVGALGPFATHASKCSPDFS